MQEGCWQISNGAKKLLFSLLFAQLDRRMQNLNNLRTFVDMENNQFIVIRQKCYSPIYVFFSASNQPERLRFILEMTNNKFGHNLLYTYHKVMNDTPFWSACYCGRKKVSYITVC